MKIPEELKIPRTGRLTEQRALEVLYYFYPKDTPLRRLLLTHCIQVRIKSLQILETSGVELNTKVVFAGTMLHDLGISLCHAPSILCKGKEPYIAHGVIGARLLRELGEQLGVNLETYARICERHTGSGITATEVVAQKLPIPVQDYLPETPEEKLVCLADKFFSKSGGMQEKNLDDIRNSMRKFGADAVERFNELCRFFRL